jgi:NADH-ubiquinone oxidoreductase chain 1
MTEHAAVVFVFFFLAEYASIVLICILTTILFLGGYLYDYLPVFLFTLIQYLNFDFYLDYLGNKEVMFSDPLVEGFVYGLSLGLKSCIMIFIFI